MNRRLLFLFGMTLWAIVALAAKDEIPVHGTFSMTISDNDDITLAMAKQRCIEGAKAEAMRDAFGEMITSDVVTVDASINGASMSSYWENTMAKVAGTWLSNTAEPKLSVTYDAGKLSFTAEVWGTARKIKQVRTELDWHVLNGGTSVKNACENFESGDALFLDFKAPAKGYLAIYLQDMVSDQVTCLLPYATSSEGRFVVEGNKKYVFFDPLSDAAAIPLKLTTSYDLENDQIIVIYSPNPFIKCPDLASNSKLLRTCSTLTFNNWLLKCQRMDVEMTVDKRNVTIRQKK